MQVPFKILNDRATVPTSGSDYAAGYDLYSINETPIIVPPHQTVKIDTGLAMALPTGYFGAIFARSGIATKRGLRPANSVGVIDSDYRGPVIVALHNDSNETQIVAPQERIAQLILMSYIPIDFVEADELPQTARGEGGFGSTGKFRKEINDNE